MIQRINFKKMKSALAKLLMVIVFLSFSAITFGQKSVVDKLYDKYSGKEGITSIYISEFMFKLIAAMDPDDEEFKNLVTELKGIKILSVEDKRYYDYFKTNIIDQIPLSEYQELMEVREDDSIVRILVKEKNGKISELLILSEEHDDASLIVMQGNIDMKSMSKLSKISGLEQLEDLELDEKK